MSEKSKEIRDQVKDYYGEIAAKLQQGKSSCCCGPSCCTPIVDPESLYKEHLDGLPAEAVNASLGCANPLAIAGLKEGETVLDLGSGGGIDVLAASRYVGQSGKVYGLDMTEEMLELANQNRELMGATNVEFLKGFIEEIPLPDEAVDVVISNCVINLSGDKEKAFREVYRVLKPGGRLAIADILALKKVPDSIRRMTEMWVGCIAGALHIDTCREMLSRAGFQKIEVQPARSYTKEMLKSLAGNRVKITDAEWESIDGAFAASYIKAAK
ncbi:S-adenosyl-L-methionine:arsenic(III) methyltransferase ArsM [Thermacetogenium phaeum DSM 12270]|uniref:Arsenite methyltransferase n=1 Tax=Thermacetogenium phaeum (strain ATCC BAA-254 / DSM 26808 / PB) TaxID=1089553 RepID=K4LD22_THEPS|nr:arsenite methyltransferase [Thermacetogenium phaeum]AFV10688.1 S-adenosyl-L-methionine:arsenic(III) methyltransferase ArsM [Thermacetogenium phaeum DSM 12270]